MAAARRRRRSRRRAAAARSTGCTTRSCTHGRSAVLPLLSPGRSRTFISDVRGRVLDQLERSRRPLSVRDGRPARAAARRDDARDPSAARRRAAARPRHAVPPGRPVAARRRSWCRRASSCSGSTPTTSRASLDNERPAHVVDVPAFRIARFPVTNGEWQAFIDDGGYAPASGGPSRLAAPERRPGSSGRSSGSADGSRRRFGIVEDIPADEPVQHVASTRRRRSPPGPAPGCRPRPSGRRPAPGIRRPGAAAGGRGATPTAGLSSRQSRRRRAAARAGRRLSRRRIGVRRRTADRRRLGVDVVDRSRRGRASADALRRRTAAVLRPGLRVLRGGSWAVGADAASGRRSATGTADPPADLQRRPAGVGRA